MENKKDTEKSAWNLSEAIIMEIGLHFQNSSRLYISQSFSKAFLELRTIVHRLSAYFTEDEQKEFRKLEDDMFYSINKSIPKSGFYNLNMEQAIAAAWVRKKYDRYNDCLMKIIKKYGLYFPNQKDKTKLST